MKVATFIEPGKMVITDTPKPVIEQETDAVIKIVRACVCGSDLWWYRGISKRESGSLQVMRLLVSLRKLVLK